MEAAQGTGGSDNIVRRLFGTSGMSLNLSAEATTSVRNGDQRTSNTSLGDGADGADGQTGAHDPRPTTAPEDTSGQQYDSTFGKSRSETGSPVALAQSAKGKQREQKPGQERDSWGSSAKRIDPRSLWTDDGEYTTPLTPRLQDRERRLQGSAAEGPHAGLGIISGDERQGAAGKTDDGRTRKSSKRSRSESLDEDELSGGLFDSHKGYRQMERALEAQRQQRTPSTTRDAPRPARRGERGVEVPKRSSSHNSRQYPAEASTLQERPRPNTTSTPDMPTEARKGNVTFRSRALSAPSSSHDSALQPKRGRRSEEGARASRQQRRATTPRQSQDAVYRAGRTGPTAGSLPPGAGQASRSPVALQSPGMASSLVMPWDPALSTALSLRNAVGDSRPSHEHYRGPSTPAGHGITLGLLSRNRAQAGFHLSALSALRARIPARRSPSLAAIRYKTWLPRLHHRLLFLLTYAHVPATIFFDYNSLYSIVQVAVYPDPDESGAAWWIATAIYAAALLVWAVGVVVVWELLIEYRRRWTDTRPVALPIYLSSPAFTLSSMRSLSVYSLLYRARLSADRRDFLIETFWFYSQNWPTVLTLLPRGIILAVFLVLYNPVSGSRPAPTTARDSVYFTQSTGLLTNFSFIILVINAAWIAWRTAVLLCAYLGLWITLGSHALYERERTYYEWQSNDSGVTAYPSASSQAALKHGEPLMGSAQEIGRQAKMGQDHRYSSVYGQESPRDEQDDLLYHTRPSVTSHRQHPARSRRASTPAIHLPRWAWRGRAEERIISLLLQGVGADVPEWPHSPGRTGAAEEQEQQGMPRMEGQTGGVEMEEIQGGNGDGFTTNQAGPSVSAALATPAPLLNGVNSVSVSSGSVSYESTKAAAPIGATAATAAPALALTRSPESSNVASTSSVLVRGGEGRDRLSSSSEFSDLNAGTTIQNHSRTGSGLTVSAASSKATAGQGTTGVGEERPTYPFPTASGDLTPRNEERLSAERARKRKSSGSTTSMRPSPSVVPTALPSSDAAGPAKRGRASSSLSSLAESLRFGRSNKSVDNVESSLPDVQEDAAATKADALDDTWWTMVFRRRAKAVEAQNSAAQQQGAAAASQGDGEKGDDGAEAASQLTHETASTEDSEERRLWSQFPEQSRRYPPGLIALDFEQKRLAADWPEDEGSRNNKPRQESPLAMVAEDDGTSGAGSTSSVAEGLLPIKEESWSSSLDSASNSYSKH